MFLKYAIRHAAQNIIPITADAWNGGWDGKYNIFIKNDDTSYLRVTGINNDTLTCEIINKGVGRDIPSGNTTTMTLDQLSNDMILRIVKHGKYDYESALWFSLDLMSIGTELINLFKSSRARLYEVGVMAMRSLPSTPWWVKISTYIISGLVSLAVFGIDNGLIKTPCHVDMFDNGKVLSVSCNKNV